MNTNRIFAVVLAAGMLASGQIVAKPSKSAKSTRQLKKSIAKHAKALNSKKLSPSRAQRVDNHLVKMVSKLSAREAKSAVRKEKREVKAAIKKVAKSIKREARKAKKARR